MQPALPSTRTQRVAVGVSLALTIQSHPPDEGVNGHSNGRSALGSHLAILVIQSAVLSVLSDTLR
jgi:hypothetical protein